MDSPDTQPNKLLRTVTAPYLSRSDSEMNILSILYGLGLVLILIPLLPFIIILWSLSLLRTTTQRVFGIK